MSVEGDGRLQRDHCVSISAQKCEEAVNRAEIRSDGGKLLQVISIPVKALCLSSETAEQTTRPAWPACSQQRPSFRLARDPDVSGCGAACRSRAGPSGAEGVQLVCKTDCAAASEISIVRYSSVCFRQMRLTYCGRRVRLMSGAAADCRLRLVAGAARDS